jgi:hypothetical protein
MPGVLKSLKIRNLVSGSAQHSYSHQRNAYERKKILVLYIKKEPKLYLKCIFSDLVNAKTKTKPQKPRLEEMDDAYYSI